jgi:3-methyladenine DNA glycosylase Tag
MTAYDEIYQAAAARNGGADRLKKRLPKAGSARALKAIPDDRYLSQMSLRVFAAGLRRDMVEKKWPAFEEVFLGFDPRQVRAINDEQLEALMGDSRIIRHWGKIKSVRHNAAAMCDISNEWGSFGAWLASWPSDDVVGLWGQLSKRFKQLGGFSGPYFLRMVGKDTFMVSPYVLKALTHWRLYDGSGKGKREQARLQQIFNDLAEESGEPLCRISMTLAQSVD